MDPQPVPPPVPPAAPAAEVDVSAGFWLRAGAYMIDGLVLAVAGAAVSVFLPAGLAAFLRLAIAIAYFTWMPAANRGQTVGKMAAGIAIVRDDGSELGAVWCFVRWIGYLVSSVLLLIGFFMAAFTERKRALHDYIAGTRVVRVEEIGAGRKALVILTGVLFPVFMVAALALIAIPQFSRMKGLAEEGQTKGRLGTLRSALSIYYGDTNGRYPETLDALVPKYVQAIEPPGLQDHPGAAGVELYGAEVCGGPKGTDLQAEKLRDTGKWGYVADPKATCYGTVFADCTHQDSKGSAWFAY